MSEASRWHHAVQRSSSGACSCTAARTAGHSSEGNALRKSRSRIATAGSSDPAAARSRQRRTRTSMSPPPGNATEFYVEQAVAGLRGSISAVDAMAERLAKR